MTTDIRFYQEPAKLFFLHHKVTNASNSVATLGPSEWSFIFLTFELQE